MNDFSDDFAWPKQDPEILLQLQDVFQNKRWGKYDDLSCRMLTNELSEYFEASHVRLCSSGTIGIEIALQGIGVKPGDEVILSAYDFPGNFRAIEAVGATPVLVDTENRSWSISVRAIEEGVSQKTKAIIASHLHGTAVDIHAITSFAKSQNLSVVEDICQCPGATLNEKKLGTFGDVAVISFGGSKLLSAGRGGALFTNNESISQRATIFCERGNNAFPLSELQAAVIRPQLRKLNELNEKKLLAAISLAEVINTIDGCSTFNTVNDSVANQLKPAFYKIPILFHTDHSNRNPSPADQLDSSTEKNSRTQQKQSAIDALRSQGIIIDHGFRGFVNRPSRRCRKVGNLQNAKNIVDETLVLHHPCLLSPRLESIGQSIKTVMNQVEI